MNPLQKPSYVNKSSFNVIPMEQVTKFSSTVGELLPVYHDIIYPGEKITLNSRLLTRTMPLSSAAMSHIVEHVDVFAVPIDQLYKPFSNWFYGINDIGSDMYLADLRSDLPHIPHNQFNADFRSKIFGNYDPYWNDLSGTRMRLFELLDIPLHKYNETTHSMPMDLNPFLACAYQKIYFDYYRNSDREVNDPTCYNLDSYALAENSEKPYPIDKFFTLRYRQWKDDFFTQRYVSPIFGANSINSWHNDTDPSFAPIMNQFVSWLTGGSFIESTFGSPRYGSIIRSNSEPTTIGVGSPIIQEGNLLSPSDIRASFAVEKLLEVTRRAGKHVDDQTLAHFGIKPSRFQSGEVEHIGHFSSDIAIGDVIATASTPAEGDFEGTALGQVGGKGYGSGAIKNLKWENHWQCPCILMAIYSAVPDVDYAVTGLGRFNTYIQGYDFFHDEFDNQGMQPLFRYQSFLYLGSAASTNYIIDGWQWRWMESKCKGNRVTGNLARSLSFWTTRRDLTKSYARENLGEFLVDPKFLDSIMVQPYQFNITDNDWADPAVSLEPTEFGVSTSLFDSDPLFHMVYFGVNKATKMSTFSLPSL